MDELERITSNRSLINDSFDSIGSKFVPINTILTVSFGTHPDPELVISDETLFTVIYGNLVSRPYRSKNNWLVDLNEATENLLTVDQSKKEMMDIVIDTVRQDENNRNNVEFEVSESEIFERSIGELTVKLSAMHSPVIGSWKRRD